MDIEKELQESITRMGDVNKQLQEIQKKIGTLQEEGRAIYNKGLELKGGIDALLALQLKEKAALESSATAKLILPEGVKPVIATPAETPALETAEGTLPPEVKS